MSAFYASSGKEIPGISANRKGVKRVAANGNETVCEAAVALLRRQRHDYLNDIQVVQAYLQMGKADKALAYLEKAVQTMQAVDFHALVCPAETAWRPCRRTGPEES